MKKKIALQSYTAIFFFARLFSKKLRLRLKKHGKIFRFTQPLPIILFFRFAENLQTLRRKFKTTSQTSLR